MTRRLIRRLLLGLATVGGVYVATFLIVMVVPGDPFSSGDRRMPAEVARALRARYDLDRPWAYAGQFLWGAMRLDFGPSFLYKDWTCTQIISGALPVSVTLGLAAILIAVLVGVPAGAVSAVHRNGWFDLSCLVCVLIGLSVPTFVTGSALLTLCAVYLKIAPIGGWGQLAHLPLPALTLSLPFMASIARLTRVGMLDVLGSAYVRTAVAKGLSRRQVVWRHAFRNTGLVVLNYLGPATAAAMTGSFVVEKVFNVPGLGQHFVDAALNLDRGLILATVLVYASILVALNTLVDLVCVWADPRLVESLN